MFLRVVTSFRFFSKLETKVLILEGNSEIGAHVMSNLCYLISLRLSMSSKAVSHWIFFSEKTYFPSCTCGTYIELPSNRFTKVETFPPVYDRATGLRIRMELNRIRPSRKKIGLEDFFI